VLAFRADKIAGAAHGGDDVLQIAQRDGLRLGDAAERDPLFGRGPPEVGEREERVFGASGQFHGVRLISNYSD